MRHIRRGRSAEVTAEPKREQGQEQQHDRHPETHPFEKPHAASGGLLVDLHEHQIRRRADRCAPAADAGGIGDAEHQRHPQAFVAIVLEHGHRHRQHHQGRSGIADPHADQAGREHEAPQQAPAAATAERAHHAEREPAVRMVALERGGHHESAHQQQDQFVAEGFGHLLRRDHPRHRQHAHRNQCGERRRHRFEQPPQCDPGQAAEGDRERRAVAAGMQPQGQQHADDGPEEEHGAAQSHGTGGGFFAHRFGQLRQGLRKRRPPSSLATRGSIAILPEAKPGGEERNAT